MHATRNEKAAQLRHRYRGIMILVLQVSLLPVLLPYAGAAPALPALQLPWPTGQTHHIWQGAYSYGCGGHVAPLDTYAIDFQLSTGDPVSAVADGIAHRGTSPTGQSYGNFVWVTHGGGIVSLYGHLSSFAVSEGQPVIRGQVVGGAGSTGNSTGTHLHFSLRSGASSWNNGGTLIPEPMSGYSGFGQYGHCRGVRSPDYTSTTPQDVPPSSYPDGTFVRVMDGQSAGLVLRAAGGTLLGLSDCAPLGGCTNLSNISQAAFSDYQRRHPLIADSTMVGVRGGSMDGLVGRAAGGALLGLSDCTPLGGCPAVVWVNEVSYFNYSNAHPLIADSTMVGVRGGSMDGLVGRAAGGALLGLSDCTPLGGCPAVVWVNEVSYFNYSNAHPLIADSTMVGVRGGSMDGLVGRAAGGALLGLSDCTPLGGCPTVVWVNEVSYFNYSNAHPLIADSTMVGVRGGSMDGLVGRAAGGALLGLSDCTPLGGCPAVVWVNEVSYFNYSNAHPLIADSTMVGVRGGSMDGLVGRAAGGALLGLSDCTPLGGCPAVVWVNEVSYFNYSNAHPLIADSTMVGVRGGSMDGLVGRAAGGALLGLSDCTPLGGCPAVVWVNEVSYFNYQSLHPTPANGTVLKGIPSATFWLIQSGERIVTSATPSAVAVNDATLTRFPLRSSALAVNDVAVTEGNSGTKLATFTVTRTGATAGTSSSRWATANGTATAGSDFVAVAPTTITFAAGETTKTVSVTVNGDMAIESNETFTVKLSAPSGATLVDDTGVGTITNDDSSLAVNDVAVTEGNSGTKLATFTVTRTGATAGTSSVAVGHRQRHRHRRQRLRGGGPDHDHLRRRRDDQDSVGDRQRRYGDESNETFTVKLSAPSGATLVDDTGVGTITNDD